MYRRAFCTVIAGIGFSILLFNPPAKASDIPAGTYQAAEHSSDVSARRKLRRHSARAWHRRYVRNAKQGRSAYRYRYRQRHVSRYRSARVARSGGGSVSMGGVVAPLAAKARQITAACGSRVVSAVRPGGRSNHASGRAVDLQGNPSCIYAMLRGWPGGVSTDYGSAPGGPHVHISYSPGGMEWGLRFAHGGRSFSASRRAYARSYGRRAYRS